MDVEVRLFAGLGKFVRPEFAADSGEALKVGLEPGSTIESLVNKLDLPRDMFLIVLVNGLRRDNDWVLQPGDRLGFFSAGWRWLKIQISSDSASPTGID